MLDPYITKMLGLFDNQKYIVADAGKVRQLQEKKEGGAVNLSCTLSADSLILHTPDQNVLPYLDGARKGARECADVFIFAREAAGWTLHVIEFKKTINTSTMAKSKRQFTMGICNAKAVAGFLGIGINTIILYSGFRKDDITNLSAAALSAIRASNVCMDLVQMWKGGQWELEVDGVPVWLQHKKIQLDAMGNGSAMI